MSSGTDDRYHVYLIEDPENQSDEIRDFINVLCQKFDCLGSHPQCKIYLPRKCDIAGKCKFYNVFQAIRQCEMILCIISPWNTNWIKYCQSSSLYKSVINGNRDKFIPVFLGYSSVEEALRACPEEIEDQTKVIFNRQWREDADSWQQLRRSLNLPEVPLTTPSDEIYGAVQCSEDSTRQMEMNMRAALEESSDELFTDEPPFSVDDDAISVPDSADENVSCHRARSLASTSNQRISDQGSNPVRFSNKKPTRLPDCRSSHLVTSSPDSSSGRPNAVNANASVESHCVDAQNETQVKQIDHVNSNYENNPAQNNCTSGEDESIVAENNCTSEQNKGIAAEDNSTGGQDESIPRDGNYNSGQEQGIPEGDNGISGQENQRHWFLGRVFSSVWNLLKYY